MAYEETLRNADLIIKDEGVRRLRLRILMLENENDDLHEQLALGDDRVDALEQESDELRTQLEQAQQSLSRQENELRAQARELNNLRAELSSMNGITTDSTKVLKEKLSLARELASLKPELEHLRTQATYQQTVLAEKLALQRQVSSLEVELETEKRVSKRAAQRKNNVEKEVELQNELEELQKDIAREKRESEKIRKEAEKELEVERRATKRAAQKNVDITERESEFQTQLEELRKAAEREKRESQKARKNAEKDLKASETKQTILESKLDQMRTNLRSAKEQLRECQTELSRVQTAAVRAKEFSSGVDAPSKNPRKRGAREMSTDVIIGTPDGVAVRGKKPVVKRGRADQMMLGEKSMFSITPFLKRTVNMAPNSPMEAEDAGRTEDDERLTEAETNAVPSKDLLDEVSVKVAVSPATLVSKPRGKKKATAPTEINTLGHAKANNQNRMPAPKRPQAPSNLERVTEEETDENQQLEVASAETSKSNGKLAIVKASKVSKTIEVEENEPKKKKRKLLRGGKTLFDEEDGEVMKRPAKIALGPSRSLGKGGLAGPKGGLRGGLGAVEGFGAFSPLKKDRRGVGASFLA